jgi:RNA polymerase sigma-70 factor, ECF subfamily
MVMDLEASLTTGMSGGTETALEALFRQEASRLWRSLFLSTGDGEVAGDAVAEAFAQALGRGDELRDPRAWVWRVAFRIASAEMGTRRRADPPGDVEGAYEMPESLVDLVRALQRLTAHQRASIVLHGYAGYSHREVAALIGSTPAAVAVHIHRARRRLRTMLGGLDG